MADFTDRLFPALRAKLLEDEGKQKQRDKRLGGLSPGGVSGTAPNTDMLGASPFGSAMFGQLIKALQDLESGLDVDTATIRKSIVGLSRVAEQVINADFSSMDNVRGPRKFALRLKGALRPGYKQEMEAKGMMLKANALTNITQQIASLQQELRMAERNPAEEEQVRVVGKAAEEYYTAQVQMNTVRQLKAAGYLRSDVEEQAAMANIAGVKLSDYIEKAPTLDDLTTSLDKWITGGGDFASWVAMREESAGKPVNPTIKASLQQFSDGRTASVERDKQMEDEEHKRKGTEAQPKPKVFDPLDLERSIREQTNSLQESNQADYMLSVEDEEGNPRQVAKRRPKNPWSVDEAIVIRARLAALPESMAEDRKYLQARLAMIESKPGQPSGVTRAEIEEILRGGGTDGDDE